MLAEATFFVLVTPSKGVPGQWVAHCLNIDLVTQGDSVQHALHMAKEAVLQVVEDDLAQGLDPLEREPADEASWELLNDTLRHGRPLPAVTEPARIKAVVANLLVTVPREALPEHARPPEVEMMPPVWQIAALRNSQSLAC